MKRSRHAVLTFALLLLPSAVALSSSKGAIAAIHPDAMAHPGLGIVQEALPAQAPLFRSAVTRVRVDAIVTDDDGNFVDNLSREDFRISEDGVEQQILNVQLVDLDTGETVDVGSQSAAHVRTSSSAGGNDAYAAGAEPTPIARTPGTLGAIVYLVDLPSLDPKNKPRLAETFTDFIKGSETLHVPRSVFMIDQHGQVQELAPLTADRDVLREAAKKLSSARLTRKTIFTRMTTDYEPIMELAIEAVNSATSGAGFVRGTPNLVNVRVREIVGNLEEQARRDGDLERDRGEATLTTLLRFTNALSAMEGRTALVWISSGALLSEGGPYQAYAAAVREAVGVEAGRSQLGRAAPNRRILDLMDELYEVANTGNVSIYTVDPRPISELNNLGTGAEVGNNLVSQALRRHVRPAYRDLTAPLHDVANKTGGRAFIGWSNLSDAFTQQADDASRFYLIFYEPPAPHADGEYHEIEVTLNKPDLGIRARSGYRDLPDSELKIRKIAAALALPGSMMGRPVPTAAYQRFTDEGTPTILLVAGLPLPAESVNGSWAPAFGGLDISGPTPAAEGGWLEAGGIPYFRVHAIALNRAGIVGGESHEVVQARPDLYRYAPDAAFRHFRYTTEWNVEPGEYNLRMVVAEDGGDRVGTARLKVEVPSSDDGWGMADPMLVAVDRRGLTPLLGQGVPEGMPIAASVQVVHGIEPFVSAAIFRRDARRSVADVAGQSLPPVSLTLHRGALHLPSNLEPGNYLVEVRVIDADADGQAIRLLPLQIIAGN